MAFKKSLRRHSGNYSKLIEYDLDVIKKDLEKVNDKIYKLQLVIDRTNLNNMIEVEE